MERNQKPPAKWKFTYNVGKKRAGHAPEGSGVPVGTEYHWYIIADQIVKKLDANNYSTEMTGSKYKVAHKRATKENWSADNAKQKREIIKILKDMIAKLETQPEPEMPAEKGKAKSTRNQSRPSCSLAQAFNRRILKLYIATKERRVSV